MTAQTLETVETVETSITLKETEKESLFALCVGEGQSLLKESLKAREKARASGLNAETRSAFNDESATASKRAYEMLALSAKFQ